MDIQQGVNGHGVERRGQHEPFLCFAPRAYFFPVSDGFEFWRCCGHHSAYSVPTRPETTSDFSPFNAHSEAHAEALEAAHAEALEAAHAEALTGAHAESYGIAVFGAKFSAHSCPYFSAIAGTDVASGGPGGGVERGAEWKGS